MGAGDLVEFFYERVKPPSLPAVPPGEGSLRAQRHRRPSRTFLWPEQGAQDVGLFEREIGLAHGFNVPLDELGQPILLFEAEIDKLVDGILDEQQHDLALAGLRDAMDPILGLQVVDQIEGPVEIDREIRLGQRQALARCGGICDHQHNLGIPLERTDGGVALLTGQHSVQGYGTVGSELFLECRDVRNE